MTKKELFTKAHEMTREIKAQHPEVNYRTQFSICLKELLSNAPETVNEKAQESIESKQLAEDATQSKSNEQEPVKEEAKKEISNEQKFMDKMLPKQNVELNGFVREVAIKITGDKMFGLVGKSKFFWNYTVDEYPAVEVAEGADKNKAAKYGRLYILKRLEMDGVKLNTKTKEKTSEYIHISEENGVWCNVFANGYIRGCIDGTHFSWNPRVHANAVAVDKSGFNGKVATKIDPARIKARLKAAGYASLKALMSAVVATTSSSVEFENSSSKEQAQDDVKTPASTGNVPAQNSGAPQEPVNEQEPVQEESTQQESVCVKTHEEDCSLAPQIPELSTYYSVDFIKEVFNASNEVSILIDATDSSRIQLSKCGIIKADIDGKELVWHPSLGMNMLPQQLRDVFKAKGFKTFKELFAFYKPILSSKNLHDINVILHSLNKNELTRCSIEDILSNYDSLENIRAVVSDRLTEVYKTNSVDQLGLKAQTILNKLIVLIDNSLSMKNHCKSLSRKCHESLPQECEG